MTAKISGLQQSAIKALPYQYLRLAVFKALEGIPISDALDFSYEEWIHREELLEKGFAPRVHVKREQP